MKIFIMAILLGFFKAFVLSMIWLWYIVPFGFPEISILQFFVLTYVQALIFADANDFLSARGRSEKDNYFIFLMTFILSIFSLFFGFIFK